ncbi:hypothetical protein HYT05_03735 [Candidatus Kaiserbacteria bacterium]|nr:hypothetical protein [Candidatus Kaiserbacteria bacterium]
MGSHDKLVQKAIQEIAQTIHQRTPEKKRKRKKLLEEALRLYHDTIGFIGRTAYDEDDEFSVGNTGDVVPHLRSIGVNAATATQLAPYICERIAEIAVDGPD